MADIVEIKRALAAQALSVAQHLLPRGKREGSEWRAGDAGGSEGRSLGVHLTGPKAGVWADFATGETGDLIDLWVAARGIGLVEALDEARAWLKFDRPQPYREAKRGYKRPPKPSCSPPAHRVRDYLTEDRNIPAEILARYKIGEQNRDTIIFPFLLPDGTLAMAKAREAKDKGKTVPTAANCEPVLFGWQAIHPNARTVVLTEGEIDALSWAAYGFDALSLPFGGGTGGKHNWIENEFERLERFEKIYLATDIDEEGEKAAQEIAMRLGRHRCYRVQMPHKDGNECLMQGVPRETMAELIRTADSLDPEGLKRPIDYTDAVVRLFWPTADDHPGYQTPYQRLRGKLHFRPAEVSLWSGASGAGKSQILSDCATDWIKQGSRICLSSLEMRPESSLKRLVKQVNGLGRPTPDAIEASLTWLDQGLLIYGLVGKISIEELLRIFDYARGKYGCDQFIIDSLMRLGVAGDDYTGQEKLVYKLVNWTVENSVHLHLVAHARKGGRDSSAPETEDVKGAMEIGANVFNILTVWRNRDHEEEISQAQRENDEGKLAELLEIPGVVFNVAKQRNGDFEGKIGLWFDQDSYRYNCSADTLKFGRTYLDLTKIRKN